MNIKSKSFTLYPRASSLHKKSGFTLIELLVVVAIIGILATVVLSSLGTARDRAKDAAIKSILSNMRAQAELQYDGDYDDICDAGTKSGDMFLSAFRKAGPSGTINNICWDENGIAYNPTDEANLRTAPTGAGIDPITRSAWAAEVFLSTGEVFCVDGVGGSGVYPGRRTSTSGPDKTC